MRGHCATAAPRATRTARGRRAAASIATLLAALLADPYFARAAAEKHRPRTFQSRLARRALAPARARRTCRRRCSHSARTRIADAIRAAAPDAREVFACGGGVHNPVLMRGDRRSRRAGAPSQSTTALGLDPDYVEAAGFAWLARARLRGAPGNMPAVTGARGPRVLGAIYPPPRRP